MRGQEIEVAGELLIANGSRALFWPRKKTAFVADVHLGKAASFRAQSIPLPHGTTQAALMRLEAVLKETGAEELVVLGDLWHDQAGKTADLLARLREWTLAHPAKRFTLVTGNHDRKAGETPKSTGFHTVEELRIGPFCCLHHPTPEPEKYVLCGHLHPGVNLGTSHDSLRLPCFFFGVQLGILPAFGEFTGSHMITPETDEDRVCVIAEDKVMLLTGRHLRSRRPRAWSRVDHARWRFRRAAPQYGELLRLQSSTVLQGFQT